MGFLSPTRQYDEKKTIGKRRYQGFVVKNTDDGKEGQQQQGAGGAGGGAGGAGGAAGAAGGAGGGGGLGGAAGGAGQQKEKPKQLHRIHVRIPGLHDDTEDDDLPMFSPRNMPSYSGSQNVGDHGPIPPVGTKVWVEFEDDTQYFGHYLGAVQNDKTKIPEFTDKGKYAESYPQAYGSVDESGTLRASDNKRDWEEWTHVTGTNWQVDGMGNTSVTVNSLEKRQDNKEAKKQFSKGFSMSVFGDVTLYVKGKLSITVKGNIGITTKGDTSIATKGKTSIQTVKDTSIMTKGKTTIASEGDMQLSSKGKLDISASDKIALQAPQITSSVDITLSKGKDPAKVSAKADFKDPDDPKARSRPEIKKPEKPPEKENSTGADASGGAGGGAGGAGGAGGGGA